MPRIGRAMAAFTAARLPGARSAPFPGFIEPSKPTLRTQVPSGERWQFEFKLDGWRAQLHRNRDAVKIYNSSGRVLDKLTSLAAAAATIPADAFVIDGELIILGENGLPNFHGVMPATSTDDPRLQFYAFDLLHLGGTDLRGVPLADRRQLLEQLLAGAGRIHMSETMDESGDALFKRAAELGIEGIVAKRVDAPYRSGRVESWVKVKCLQRQALTVVGFVPAKGGSIAALRLGRREGGKLVYAGKVGTGFSARSAQTVRQRLEPLIRAKPPLAKPLNKPGTVWVEPKLQANVEFLELTADGMVRHASFKGLTE